MRVAANPGCAATGGARERQPCPSPPPAPPCGCPPASKTCWRGWHWRCCGHSPPMWWPLPLSTSKSCWSRERVSGPAQQHPSLHLHPLPHAAWPACPAWHHACHVCLSPGVLLLPHVPIARGIRPAPCARHPWHCAFLECPSPRVSLLPHALITQGVTPTPCAHCPWHCACPMCPSPRAPHLPLAPILEGLCTFPSCPSRVAPALPRVPILCGIKPPPSPDSSADLAVWGAQLEDEVLTQPLFQVGCPPRLPLWSRIWGVQGEGLGPRTHPGPAALVPHHLNFRFSCFSSRSQGRMRRRTRTRRRRRQESRQAALHSQIR